MQITFYLKDKSLINDFNKLMEQLGGNKSKFVSEAVEIHIKKKKNDLKKFLIEDQIVAQESQ